MPKKVVTKKSSSKSKKPKKEVVKPDKDDKVLDPVPPKKNKTSKLEKHIDRENHNASPDQPQPKVAIQSLSEETLDQDKVSDRMSIKKRSQPVI